SLPLIRQDKKHCKYLF
ncbi:hypothetical protein D043_2003B, partial [Vibrio parahaemolyticus EKP-021]